MSKKDDIQWYVREITPEEDARTPDYDADALQATDEADKYRSNHQITYEQPSSRGYRCIRVLQDLWARPWDQFALNMMAALRPSCIRVVGPDSHCTCDAVTWRVTVLLENDNRTIRHIEQEVQVGLVGAKHGHGLSKYERDEHPTSTWGFFNPRARNVQLGQG